VTSPVIQFFRLVIMRCDFEQPRVLDLDHLPHELLGGEDKFVVDDPARSVFGQTAVWVNGDRLLVLHGLVHSTLAESRCVVEEPGSDCLSTSHQQLVNINISQADVLHTVSYINTYTTGVSRNMD